MAIERITDLAGRTCSICGVPLTALAGRYDVVNRKDPVYTQDDKTLECPNGHDLPSETNAS